MVHRVARHGERKRLGSERLEPANWMPKTEPPVLDAALFLYALVRRDRMWLSGN